MSEWIEWKGGKCPVDNSCIVDLKFRGGMALKSCTPGCYTWGRMGTLADITAYRIVSQDDPEDFGQQNPVISEEHTGNSVSYYDVTISNWTNPEHQQDTPVTVSCNDIIEALEMNYAQANVVKAQWRIAAAKQGKM